MRCDSSSFRDASFGCGTTHAVVRTSDSGYATITITTNNPTSVQASPNVSLDVKGNND